MGARWGSSNLPGTNELAERSMRAVRLRDRLVEQSPGLCALGRSHLFFSLSSRVCVACNLSNFLGDDFSGANERYRREVESVLSVDSNGRVLAEGDVSMLGQSCDISEASCRVILVVGGVVVSVYYRANSDGGACRNSNADALVEKLGIGDRVRV